jgi:ubiquinone/menaquinone biosynthesis C-methylase UbiE
MINMQTYAQLEEPDKVAKPDMSAAPSWLETADIETSSDDYARRFSGPVGKWFLEVQEKATLEMLLPYKNGTVLDVGGGHGQLAGGLIGAGYDLTVLGSANSCVEKIRTYVDQGLCKFQVGNVLDLPFPDQYFDAVISYRFISHVTRWEAFLGELCRIARKAVIFDYTEVKSINAIAPYLFQFKKRLEGNTRPFTLYREADLLRILGEHGFSRSDRFSQFFLPMVVHRKMKVLNVSRAAEGIFRKLKLTDAFGSPVILKAERRA